MPHYDDEAPSKSPDAQYSYTFKEWEPALAPVYADAIYTARYEASVNSYVVRFVNEDGTLLQESSWDYGKTPEYLGKTPLKTAGVDYRYAFEGWSPMITPVSKKATYVAQFSKAIQQYTITFLDEDGSKLESKAWDYGSTPSYGGSVPKKSSTDSKTYSFAGWVPEIASVQGEATYRAHYEEGAHSYEIRFLNTDGSILQSSLVAYGETPVYSGLTPSLPATAEFSYLFNGWDKTIVPAVGEAAYTATYVSTKRSYPISFFAEDGTLIECSYWTYGDTPVFQGKVPLKASTVDLDYTFSDWTPSIAPVSGEASYHPNYQTSVRRYTVTFANPDGSVISTLSVPYGTTPTYSGSTPTYDVVGRTFSFKKWDNDFAPVGGDQLYTAQYTELQATDALTFEYDENSKTFAVSGCNYSPRGITIPTTFDDGTHSAPVTAIKWSSFCWHSNLTSIVIPEGITTIQDSAFYGCGNLRSLRIPKSATSISGSAWRDCHHLDDLLVDSDNPNYSSENNAFFDKNKTILYGYNGSVTSFEIPSSVSKVNDYAFYNDELLTSVTIPEGVTTLSQSAFEGCSSLSSLTLPSTLTTLGSYAFSRCYALEKVQIPGLVSSIGFSVFLNCPKVMEVTVDPNNASFSTDGKAVFNKNKTTLVVYVSSDTSYAIPEGVTRLEYLSFNSCAWLSSVSFPSTLKSIGWSAFSGCSSLQSVLIPEGVTGMESQAFSSCSGLTTLSLPSTLVNVNSSFLDYCHKIDSLSVAAGNSALSTDGKALFNADKSSLITYPSPSTQYEIPSGVKTIKYNAFATSPITSVSIPETVQTLEYCAFYNTPLTSAVLPSSLTILGSESFGWCSSLASVTFGSGLTQIGSYCFYDTSISSVSLPASLTSIDYYGFAACRNLKDVSFLGSMAQWSSVSLNSQWKQSSPFTAIVCSDGSVSV